MLWLIGGTGESGAIAQALHQAQIPYLVTVTTEAARSLYPQAETLQIRVGHLPPEAMADFIQTHALRAILDASHPFATRVSQGAMAAARTQALPYLRFERPSLSPDEAQTDTDAGMDLDDLLNSNRLYQRRVLLVLGYRLLHHFRPWQDQATLFARILPSTPALQAALAAGFSPRRLIALRPPISPDLERALWQQWQIDLVIAKASGSAGGEAVKRAIAQSLKIELLLLRRPQLTYPQQTASLEEAIAFARRHTQT